MSRQVYYVSIYIHTLYAPRWGIECQGAKEERRGKTGSLMRPQTNPSELVLWQSQKSFRFYTKHTHSHPKFHNLRHRELRIHADSDTYYKEAVKVNNKRKKI